MRVMRLCLAVVALSVTLLYFGHVVLIAGGTVLIYWMILPLIIGHNESRKRRKLRKEALDWMEVITMNLKAGKGLTQATMELATGLSGRDGGAGAKRPRGAADGPDEMTAMSWRHCLGLIRLHYPIGKVYQELANRLVLPELQTLAALIETAVDTGASLPQVFIRSAEGLRRQLESLEKLESALASRRMEGCLLAAAPAIYTAFLRLVAPEYMAPLYTGNGWLAALAVFGFQLGGCYSFFRLITREETEMSELELAGFQEEIALHLQAGLSLPEAWQRAAGSRIRKETVSGKENTAFHSISLTSRHLHMGMPFAKALKPLLQEKGGDTEASRMAAFLIQNYQTGGGSLAALLSLEAEETRRRCLLRQQSKSARQETVLLFPMLLLLLSALLLTAAPALLGI